MLQAYKLNNQVLGTGDLNSDATSIIDKATQLHNEGLWLDQNQQPTNPLDPRLQIYMQHQALHQQLTNQVLNLETAIQNEAMPGVINAAALQANIGILTSAVNALNGIDPGVQTFLQTIIANLNAALANIQNNYQGVQAVTNPINPVNPVPVIPGSSTGVGVIDWALQNPLYAGIIILAIVYFIIKK